MEHVKLSYLHFLLLVAHRLPNDINKHYAQMLACLFISYLNSSKYSKAIIISCRNGLGM